MAHFLFCMLFVACPVLLAGAVEITAHRGASYTAPENTLAAVDLAWQLGADSTEIDVFQSRDGQIVVIHDEDTKRTGGVDLKVADTSLDQLKSLDVGEWKEARWAGETIPTLAEVLATIPEGRRLLIEIKCGTEIVPQLHRVLAASEKRAEQIAVISFDPDVLSAVKEKMPELHVQWVLGTIPQRDQQTGEIRMTLREAIDRCRQASFDGLSVCRDSEIDERFVRQVHDAGLELHVWTVNSAQEAKNLVELGVDALTTDRPGYLREHLPDR